MASSDRHIVRGPCRAIVLLALASSVARAGSADDALARALVERTVLRPGATPGEQVRALSQAAHLVRGPSSAEGLLPLCQQVIRSRSLADRNAALSAAECLAVCLFEARRPFVAIRGLLMSELPTAGTPAARSAVLEVAERFYAFLDRHGQARGQRFAGQVASVPQCPVHFEFDGLAICARDGRRAERPGSQAALAAQAPTRVANQSDTVAFTPPLRVIRPQGLRVAAPGERAPAPSHAVALPAAIEAAANATLAELVNAIVASVDAEARAGNTQAALDILAKLVRDLPDSASSAQALARALAILATGAREGGRANELEAFEQWVAKHGGPRDRVQARLLVLQQHYRDEDYARARDGVREFLKQHGASDFGPRARLLLGLVMWKMDERAGASKVLSDLVRDYPGHPLAPQAQFLVGYFQFSDGQTDAARAAFLRVVNDYPDSEFAAKALDFLGGEAAKRAEAQGGKPVWRALPGCSCPRAAKPITIDGRLDEAEWQGAAVLKLIHRDDAGRETPDPDATVRLLWDAQCLYVGFECKDSDVRSDAKERDDPVLLWDAFRVLLAPTPGAKDVAQFPQEGAYYDFLVAPNGVLSDAKVEYSRGVVVWQNVKNSTAWNSPNVRWAARVQGTLNDAAADRGWTAELAIPFADLGGSPIPGSTWRLDVLRAEKTADRERSLSSWAPFTGWLPQVREFGRIAFAPTEPK